MDDPHKVRWETAVRSYLDTIDGGEDLYHNDAAFHAAVTIGGEVVVGLLGAFPGGAPRSGLDHMVRRIAMTSQAALIEHRGQMDVDQLLADGWKWGEGEEQAFGKRLRWLIPPEGLFHAEA